AGGTGVVAVGDAGAPAPQAAVGVDGVAGELLGRDPPHGGQAGHLHRSGRVVVRGVAVPEGAAHAAAPRPDGAVPVEREGDVVAAGHLDDVPQAAHPHRFAALAPAGFDAEYAVGVVAPGADRTVGRGHDHGAAGGREVDGVADAVDAGESGA